MPVYKHELGEGVIRRTQAGTNCGVHKSVHHCTSTSLSFLGSKTKIMTSALHSANEATQ